MATIAKNSKIKHNNYMKKFRRLTLLIIIATVMVNLMTGSFYRILAAGETDINNATSEEYKKYSECRANVLSASANATEDDVKSACGDTLTSKKCNLEGAMGYIMCPFVWLVGESVSTSYRFINSFFILNPSFFQTNSVAHQVWSNVRNIANLGLVVFFMIIVISQVSNFGLSNYSIKKILPKLVVIAILINLSFYLCQFLIDLSNIIGTSVVDFFKSATSGIVTGADPGVATIGQVAIGSVIAILGGVMALRSNSVRMALFSVIMPLLITFVLVMVTTGLMLLIRQAGSIVIVTLAPVAVLCLAFPNTEGVFKFWKQAFSAILIVFPIVGLLFGASALVSGILTKSSSSFLMQALGIVTSGMPLFFAPQLIKSTMASMPAIGGRLTALASRAESGGVNKFKNSRLMRMHEKRREQFADRMDRGDTAGMGRLDRGLSVVRNAWNRRTLSGRAYLGDLEDKYQSSIQSMSAGLNNQDSQAIIAAVRNGDNIDETSLSDNARQRLAGLGLTGSNNSRELAAAAAMQQASRGDLNIDNYNHLMGYASSQGMTESSLLKINENIRQSSADRGRFDTAGYARAMANSGLNSGNIAAQSNNNVFRNTAIQNQLMQMNSDELSAINPDALVAGTDGFNVMQNLYRHNSAFAAVQRQAAMNKNVSTATSNALRNAR